MNQYAPPPQGYPPPQPQGSQFPPYQPQPVPTSPQYAPPPQGYPPPQQGYGASPPSPYAPPTGGPPAPAQYQQPGYPPGPPGYGVPVQQQPQYGMPGPQPVAPQMVTTLPQLHMPDPAAIEAAYAAAAAEQQRVAAAKASGGGFEGGKFFNPPGPDGSFKWKNVAVGFKSQATIWICTPHAHGQMLGVEQLSHFLHSARAPQGENLPCPGEGRCPFCMSRNLLYRTGAEADAARAKKLGKARHQYLYNVIWLENPQSHVDPQTGKMWAHILKAPSGLHTDLWDVFRTFGMLKVIDPNMGRPIRLTRTQEEAGQMGARYGAPMPLDPIPLPQQYWGCLQNLNDLGRFQKGATREQMQTALAEHQMPMTNEVQAALMALPSISMGSGQPGPAPVGYPQQPPPGYPPMQQPGVYGAPPGYPPPQMAPQGYGQPNLQPSPQHPTNAPYDQMRSQLYGNGR